MACDDSLESSMPAPVDARQAARLQFRSATPRMLFLNEQGPGELRAAVAAAGGWTKAAFDVKSLIGKTQVVWVYQATCKLSGWSVALKCYRKDQQSQINHQQIEREMNVQALLRHENVLQIYGAFEDDTFVYLVLELADGGDVYRNTLALRRRLSEPQLVSVILAPLLHALAHAHAVGVIHRDVKPENIFLHSRVGIVLGDWGLAIDGVRERPVSRVGTLDYMAPDVLAAPSLPPGVNLRAADAPCADAPGSYDHRVDLYAAGAIAYEFLYGRPPFYRKDRAQKKALILRGELVFPAAPATTALAQSFISKAMCARPAERGSAAQLLQHPWILAHVQTRASAPKLWSCVSSEDVVAAGDAICGGAAKGSQISCAEHASVLNSSERQPRERVHTPAGRSDAGKRLTSVAPVASPSAGASMQLSSTWEAELTPAGSPTSPALRPRTPGAPSAGRLRGPVDNIVAEMAAGRLAERTPAQDTSAARPAADSRKSPLQTAPRSAAAATMWKQ